MSYDLTLFHAPRLASFDRAMARLEERRPPKARERKALLAAAEQLAAELHLEAHLDEQTATLGLSLAGSQVEAALAALPALLTARGLVCYDPQEGVFTYANGRDSRLEKVTAGVHEGVGICLAELAASPALPVSEQRDAIEALLQFALADSPDPAAAARLALPALLALAARSEPAVADPARSAAYDLVVELGDRELPLGLPEEAIDALCEAAPAWLAAAIRAAQG